MCYPCSRTGVTYEPGLYTAVPRPVAVMVAPFEGTNAHTRLAPSNDCGVERMRGTAAPRYDVYIAQCLNKVS